MSQNGHDAGDFYAFFVLILLAFLKNGKLQIMIMHEKMINSNLK